jgi:hypothetical protein
MFKVFNNSNIENAIYIQGARHSNTSPIGSVVFQNYDFDTNQTYTMAAMSLKDHFGNASSNGYGDLVFKSKTPSSQAMVENVKIQYDGKVIIGDPSSTACKLNVAGSIHADGPLDISNIRATELLTSNMATQFYKTQKIMFNKYSSSNYVQNLVLMMNSNTVQLDASCLVSGFISPNRLSNIDASTISSGYLSPAVFPSSIVFDHLLTSNLTTYTNTSTPRVSFVKGSNATLVSVGSNINITVSNVNAWGSIKAKEIAVGYPSLSNDAIKIYHDYKNWEPDPVSNNITITNFHSRYSRVNQMIHLHYSYLIASASSNTSIRISLPVPPKFTTSNLSVFTDISGNDIFGKTIIDSAASNLHFKSSQFSIGHWYISNSLVYESIA